MTDEPKVGDTVIVEVRGRLEHDRDSSVKLGYPRENGYSVLSIPRSRIVSIRRAPRTWKVGDVAYGIVKETGEPDYFKRRAGGFWSGWDRKYEDGELDGLVPVEIPPPDGAL